MRIDVMKHYGLTVPLSQAGYYETNHHKQLMTDIHGAILDGRLVALSGVIGSGKTVMLERIQQMLVEEKQVIVSKSYAIDKRALKLSNLVTALFYDLSGEKQIRVPADIESRDRQLYELVKKRKRPVVLFVDEAHDLNIYTLTSLKRLIELARGGSGSGRLSVVLAGHPKLKNDLRRPTMEEIGHRASLFSLDGIAGSQREYIYWLLGACSEGKVEAESILTEDAIDLLATKLRTPLQVEQYLRQALEAGYQIGEMPVSAEIINTVLTRHSEDIEPTLTRNGYRIKDLAEQFDAKPAEIKALFAQTLDPIRSAELREKMLAAGLPI
jgi:type II secretory pathway predicted ATPase ExeA